MYKINFFLYILMFNLFFCNVNANHFLTGQIIKNKFIYDNNIKINLTEGDWVVFRNQISLDYGIKQKIVGIGRLENNEIMEMIEIYKGDLAGDYVHWINIALNEIIFKDKHDGCYERPEYYLLELYKKGSSYNCMVVRHIDVTKELNYPDGVHGKAAAAFYNLWINKNSLKYSKIMLGTYHGYFSRLSGGNWIEIRHFINPKIINAPKSKFFSEETSEYHKANIIDHPRHQKSMNQWLAISSEFHKSFEEMVKAKSHHKLNLDQYYMPIKNINKSNNQLTDQLNELNELYKTGVLTKEEFKKAKKKILN